MKKILGAAVLFIVTMFGSVAEAAFIDSGTYLTDFSSGLDWLDLTASTNRSYADVAAQFGVSGDYAGWRYATGHEFDALIADWTSVPTVVPYAWLQHGEGAGSIDGLSMMLGITYDSGAAYFGNPTSDASAGVSEGAYYDLSVAFIADAGAVSGHWTAFIEDADCATCSPDQTAGHYTLVPDTFVTPYWGSFLVRDTSLVETSGPTPPATQGVPEPTTVALLGLGLAGLFFSRRKVKAKTLS